METIAGITYTKPQVTLLQQSGIGVSEYAARTCYDSFDKSENDCVQKLDFLIHDKNQQQHVINSNIEQVNNIEHSDLLDTLAWTHFHYSILEHATLSYLIRGTSRAVLQEHARHRIQAISVRSTRYTMQDILHAFNACRGVISPKAKIQFKSFIKSLNMFTVTGVAEDIEILSIYTKLNHQISVIGEDNFIQLTMSKSAQDIFSNKNTFESPKDLFNALCDAKSKRNVGDKFKWIVSDMWAVDMVVTFNIRSLKNYFQLRDSGAAYFGIQYLAQTMKKVTPSKYLDLIIRAK